MSFSTHLYGTAAQLASRNPLVPKGALAGESDTGVIKMGDGVTRYNSLLSSSGGGGTADKLGLTPTAVKTTNYSASAGDFVPVDTTGGNVTVTFPTAPADGSVVAVKQVTRGGTNTVALALGGSDKFNTTGGATSGTITLASQSVVAQYKSSAAVWYVVAGDLPLSGLDARYLQVSNNLSDVTAATARTNLGLGTAATQSTGTFAQVSNNLSDVTAATARTNLGVGASVQVDTYAAAASTTWTKPTGAKLVRFQVWGAGGGGGSGRRGAAASVRCGGGGGGGGGYVEEVIPASSLPSSLNIFVGAGGPGGAAQTANDTNGTSGTAGGSSAATTGVAVTTSIGSGGFRVFTSAGGAGGGGTNAAGSAGSNGTGATNIAGGAGGAASGSGGSGGAAGNITALSATGGGGGGGITSGDVASAGGGAGLHNSNEGVVNGGAIDTSGPAGYTPVVGHVGASGGGGGGSSITTTGGTGGAGGFPGGGGGGGGASLNGNNSGAGGAGGDGLIVITTWF